MKRQSDVPRLRIPRPKVGKSRKQTRFVSILMKKIQEEVERGHANIRPFLGNGRKGKDRQTMQGLNMKICPSTMVINKLCKGNYTEKDQRDNHVLPQSNQHLLDGGKVGLRKLDAMKEDFPPMTSSPKSDKSVTSTVMNSMTSKMKQEFVHRPNDAKMSSSQPMNLKAMQGLVLNQKGRFTVDQGQATWMGKRERMDGCNDITNDDNLGSRKESLVKEKLGDNLGSRRELHDNLHLGSRKELHDNLHLGSRKELHDNLSNRKELLLEEKPKSHDDNGSEGENPTHRMNKRQRKYKETNENEDDNGGPDGLALYSSRLTSQDDIAKDCHDGVSMPFVADCLGKQYYCCSKPSDEPIWRGLLNTGKEYIPLFGHLSTKSCEKVHNLSKSLSRVVEVTKLPRLKVWPKRWDESRPLNGSIGLYFFPPKMRPDKSYDQLLKEVMENDLALRAIIGDTEMLMFPSTLLPQRYKTFQMKHYLWGVFKPKEVDGKHCAAQHQPDHTTGATAFAANSTATGIATDAASIPTEDAPTAPANHGRTDSSSMGAPPGRMLAFVVKQTPRLEQLIREMQREGALVMQGEMMSTGSWPGN
ncbi:hypothetical protein SETIT_2G149000v2 [Setaria italica]|uniref:AIPP2-like SPOC-like domain-containing protein n=1 Tax=Setaria italica TaxID=4555 RepID=A0A368PZ65_SETIT|nr:uncharacterized protein LOC101756415 [Setaria italica]RCV10949.1 hypothetical protein SETIT_2G149000v2 [Setaria italica]